MGFLRIACGAAQARAAIRPQRSEGRIGRHRCQAMAARTAKNGVPSQGWQGPEPKGATWSGTLWGPTCQQFSDFNPGHSGDRDSFASPAALLRPARLAGTGLSQRAPHRVAPLGALPTSKSATSIPAISFSKKNGPQNGGHFSWSGRSGLNRRHSAWEADVLPLNYARRGSRLAQSDG